MENEKLYWKNKIRKMKNVKKRLKTLLFLVGSMKNCYFCTRNYV